LNKLNGGIVTVNEVRRDYGLEPVAWGDVPNTVLNNDTDNELDYGDSENVLKQYKNNVVKSGLFSEWSNKYGKW
jgi:hypothetical protein